MAAKKLMATQVAAGVKVSLDGPRLMELMQTYQVVGDGKSRLGIMCRSKNILSAAGLWAMSEALA